MSWLSSSWSLRCAQLICGVFVVFLFVLGSTVWESKSQVVGEVEPVSATDTQSRRILTDDMPCDDPEWCSIPAPSVSYFRFDPPTDPKRWRMAQIQAARGDHVLLEEVMKVFPNHFDFLDGDIAFRKLHLMMDMFVDENRDLTPLTTASKKQQKPNKVEKKSFSAASKRHNKQKKPLSITEKAVPETDDEERVIALQIAGKQDALLQEQRRQQQLSAESSISRRRLQERPKLVNGKLQYSWEVEGRYVVPEPHDFRRFHRAPIVSVGYTAFLRDNQAHFMGNRIGGAFPDRHIFFKHWRKALQRLDTPFLAVCALNENWGMLSTNFPNRTAGWGNCCDKNPRDRIVYDFLNHEKTLLLVTNQHTNVSHPKLLILPRGMPIGWGWTRVLIWDTMRLLLNAPPLENAGAGLQKNTLLFATGSSWGPRPQILRCISQQFTPSEFVGHQPPLDTSQKGGALVMKGSSKTNRLGREDYYLTLGRARFGLGLPGLGYDCFRNWELLTLGSIVVLEKGVGLDRLVSEDDT